MNANALITMVVVGLVAGLLASVFVGGSGIVYYLIIGVIGSFVGGFVFNALGINLKLGNPLIGQIVTSTIGAIIVVILARIIT